MITLIIVDCQNDFITGSMSVNGAKEVVNNIKNYIQDHRKEIDRIVFTVDWHPYNHCSFKKYGGLWAAHCIQYTPGACIEPKLLKLVQSFDIPYSVAPKGEMEEIEQYGAFNDIEFRQDATACIYYLDYVRVEANTDFVICGIAGDYCVKSTIENLLNERIVPKVFMNGVASIDNGTTIKQFIKDKGLEIV